MSRIVFFVLTLLFSAQLWASIGKVSAVRGEAHFLRGDQEISIQVGDAVEEKDRIKTGANTQVQVVFSDRTIVTIGKNTDFSIPEYVYGDAKTSKARFNLVKGVFKAIDGKIGKIAPQRFKIKAGTATIGIRGTTYIVRVIGSETSLATLNGATYMELNSGKTYEVPAGKELVYNIDTGKVTVQDISTTSVSVNTPPSDNGKTQTGSSDESGSGSSGSGSDDDAKSSVDTSISSTESTNQTITTETTKVKVQAGSDTYTSYGYWLNQSTQVKSDPYSTPLSGVSLTPSSVLSSASSLVNYSGNLVAISGTTSVTGTININIGFMESADGNMSFTLNGNNWNNDFSQGSYSVDYANSKIVFNQFTSTGNVSNITGNVTGYFYGSQAQGMGGTFNLSGTASGGTSTSAQGSFAASSSGVTGQ